MTKVFGTQFCGNPFSAKTPRTFNLSSRNVLKLQAILFKVSGYPLNPRKAQRQLRQAALSGGFYQVENMVFSRLGGGWCNIAVLEGTEMIFTK